MQSSFPVKKNNDGSPEGSLSSSPSKRNSISASMPISASVIDASFKKCQEEDSLSRPSCIIPSVSSPMFSINQIKDSQEDTVSTSSKIQKSVSEISIPRFSFSLPLFAIEASDTCSEDPPLFAPRRRSLPGALQPLPLPLCLSTIENQDLLLLAPRGANSFNPIKKHSFSHDLLLPMFKKGLSSDRKIVELRGKLFSRLDRKNQNISSSKLPIAVCNAGMNVFFLLECDPEETSRINTKFENIRRRLKKQQQLLSEKEILQVVVDQVRKIFFYTSDCIIRNQVFQQYFETRLRKAPQDEYKKKFFSLMRIEKFVKHWKGNPQIYAIITAYFLDCLTKESTSSRLLDGTVQYMHDKPCTLNQEEATARRYWATFTSRDDCCRWHVDAYENVIEDFHLPEGKKRLEKIYGQDLVTIEAKYTKPAFESILNEKKIQLSENKTIFWIASQQGVCDNKKEVSYNEKLGRLYLQDHEYRRVEGEGRVDFNHRLFVCNEKKDKVFFIFNPTTTSLNKVFEDLKEGLNDILNSTDHEKLKQAHDIEQAILESILHRVKDIFSLSEKWIREEIDMEHQVELKIQELKPNAIHLQCGNEIATIVDFETMMKWKIGLPYIYGIVTAYLLHCFRKKSLWMGSPLLEGVVHYLRKEMGGVRHWGVIFQSFYSGSLWRIDAMGMQTLKRTAYCKADTEEFSSVGISKGVSLEKMIVVNYPSILYSNYLMQLEIENAFYVRASTKVAIGGAKEYKVVVFRQNHLGYLRFILTDKGKIFVQRKGKRVQIENFDLFTKQYGLNYPITDEMVESAEIYHTWCTSFGINSAGAVDPSQIAQALGRALTN